MADRVYTQEEIQLGDYGDEFTVTIRPNPIARQRKFMDRWEKNLEEINKKQKAYEKAVEDAKAAGKDEESIDQSKYDTDPFDGYIELVAICLEKQLADRVKDDDGIQQSLYDDKRKITPAYREFLEEVLDQESIFRIIEICGGIKLNDPNLIQAVMESQIEAEQSGAI